MNASDWKFTKLIPDIDDIEAVNIACNGWIKYLKGEGVWDSLPRGMPNEILHAFSGGFIRGMKWAQDKEEFLNE